MRICDIESIRPGNPFLSDPFLMGTRLGTNVVVMYENHPHQPCKHLVIVDTNTGERKQIQFD